MEETTKNVHSWLQDVYDEETKKTILLWCANQKFDLLQDAFGKKLEWGTGGVRAKDGIGTSRINKYNIVKISLAFLHQLQEKWDPEQSIRIAIAFDNRFDSSYYAQVAAQLLTALGVQVKFFDVLSPLPLLSLGIRYHNCHGGIMITGGSSERGYNGVKLLNDEGSELSPALGRNLMAAVSTLDRVETLHLQPEWKAVDFISEEVEDTYLGLLSNHLLFQHSSQASLRILYSPWQGTGTLTALPLLEQLGFPDMVVVNEHFMPAPYFDDMPAADPTAPDALNSLYAAAEAQEADVIIASNCDCSRVAVATRDAFGSFKQLNGHQMAALAVDYVLTQYRRNNLLTDRHVVLKNTQTSQLVKSIAHHNGISCVDVPTGLPADAYIHNKEVLLGVEESGSLVLPHLGPIKDGLLYAGIMLKVAQEADLLGWTLWDKLKMLHLQHGLYVEKTATVSFSKYGAENSIPAYLKALKEKALRNLDGEVLVLMMKDLESGEVVMPFTGETSHKPNEQAVSMLHFRMTDGIEVYVRVSQTSPGIKIYASAYQAMTDRTSWLSQSQQLEDKITTILSTFKAITHQ